MREGRLVNVSQRKFILRAYEMAREGKGEEAEEGAM